MTFSSIKTKFLGPILGLSVVAIAALAIAFPGKVAAAGEKYVLDFTNGNPIVTVSGGDLKSSAKLTDTGKQDNFGNSLLAGTVTYKTGCTFTLTISVPNVDSTLGTIADASGGNCSAAIKSQYTSAGATNISIQGVLATSGKIVVNTSASDQTSPPASDTVTIESSDGKTVYATQVTGSTTTGTYVAQFTNPNNGATKSFDGQACSTAGHACQTFHKVAGVSLGVNVTAKPLDAASSSSNNADPADCGAGSLNWVICPLTTLMADTATKLDSFITNQMTVDTSSIFGNSSSAKSYFKAWNTFRIIGTALIVIAGLVMVASEAFGLEILDAYTVRKTLPRLLIAVIGISLSWPLLQFIIGFFNVLGNDIEQLIFAPFSGIQSHGQALGGALNWTAIVLGILAAATGFGAVVFPIIGMVVLSLLLAFLIIVVRSVAVTLLVILAPIAIACYVLPNTKKVWDLWRENFLGLMVMFPIVMALIAAGHVFAAIGEGGGVAEQFIGMIANFIGYFLILFAFRAATGLISTLTGIVNDRSKGAFDRLKNARGNITQKAAHNIRSGNAFSGGTSSNFRGRLNRGLEGATNLNRAGLRPSKMRARMQAGSAAHMAGALAEYMEKDSAFGAIKGNDDYLQATMKNMGGGETENDWRRYLVSRGYEGRSLEQGVAAIRNAQRNVSSEIFEKAAVMANASTGTGWKEGGVAQMMQSINDAAGGDRHTANSMLAQMRGMAGQAGRLDLAGSGFGVQSTQLERMYAEQASTGSVSDATLADVKHQIHGNLLETKGANEFARARGQAVQQIAPEMLYDLQQAHAKVATATTPTERRNAERELAQKYASVANFHDSLNHMAPENAKLIADGLLSRKIYAGDTKDIMARIDEYRTSRNADYLATRKDYDARQYREEGGPPPTEPS